MQGANTGKIKHLASICNYAAKAEKGRMILFSPMWGHEIERLGWRHCSPVGYLLLNVSDGLSWLALILWIAGWGWPGLLAWLLGRVCYGVSLWLCLRRHFVYDAQTLSGVSWQNRRGEPCRYSWAEHVRDEGAP